MKIVSCYIRDFGGLKDVSIEFEDGLNQFICDNGVGKTTVISFIKAMLYGMEYRQGRAKFYERTHFMPWDKSECGGSLVFIHDGKTYRIDRTFGTKQSEDSFSIFDENTMRPSEDFDADVGERIFGVDRESFEKSMFFGQSALDTGITNSINAKMGNLTDVRDDMNRFDEAIKSIENAKQEYVKRGTKNPGKISLIDKDIKNCEQALESIPVLENAIRERKRGIEEKLNKIEELTKSKNELSEKIKEAAKKKEQEGAVNAQKEQLNKLIADKETEVGFFDNKILEVSEIEEMQKIHRSYVEKNSKLDVIKARLPQEERVEFLSSVFGGENPATKQLIDISKEEQDQISKLKASGEVNAMPQESEKDLNLAREFFENMLPNSEEITELMRQTETINKLEAENNVLGQRLEEVNSNLENISEQKNRPYFVIMIIGVVALIAGLSIGLLALQEMVSIIGMIAGIVIGTILILTSLMFLYQDKVNTGRIVKDYRNRKEDLEQQIQKATDEANRYREICEAFIAKFPQLENSGDIMPALVEIQRRLVEYERLNQLYEATKKETAENTDSLADLMMNLYTRLDPVAQKYGIDLHSEHREKELLDLLSGDIKEYDAYLEDLGEVRSGQSELDRLREQLESFIGRFRWEEEMGTEKKLHDLKARLDRIAAISGQIETLKEQIKEVNHDEEEVSLEELQKENDNLDEQQKPLLSDVAKEEEELSRIVSEIEEKEEEARSLLALKEKRAEMEERVEVLSDTKKYLEQARDEFLSVYMKPLREKMDKYVSEFIPEENNNFAISLDMDLSIKLKNRGSIYSGEYLSEGYTDMAAMCARLSLIDVLYKNSKPPVFLDDPFTNLDEIKIQKALSILENIGKETQVIYFTCHQSRVTKGSKTFDPEAN